MEQEIINLKQQIIDLKVENYNLKMELKELMPKKDYKKLEQTKVINCKTCGKELKIDIHKTAKQYCSKCGDKRNQDRAKLKSLEKQKKWSI